MKTSAIVAVAAALLLASCASPLERRIDRNQKIFVTLNERHRSLVSRGQIEEGMSKDAVFIAWGHPDRIAGGSRDGKKSERWSYTGYDTVQSTRLGVGGGFGYWHGRYGSYYDYDPYFYPQTVVHYLPFEAAYVEFVGDRVRAWSSAR